MKMLIALALLQAPPHATCRDQREAPLIQSAKGCILDYARRLSLSGETADIVADAAITKCTRAVRAVRDMEGICRGHQPGKWFSDGLFERLHKEAVLAVVEARASRHR